MIRSRVLLIGWQAADWHLLNPFLDAGQMPHLEALLSRGVMGTLSSPEPLVPSLLWSSLATGRRASGHGILGDGQREGAQIVPASLHERNCPAFWDLLRERSLKTHLINWPLSTPAEDTGGVAVGDRFFMPASGSGPGVIPKSVYPESHSAELNPFLISPGEVDAATLRFFLPDLGGIPRTGDDRPGKIAMAVAQALSVHTVTTWLMENHEWDVTAVRFSLLADLSRWALPLAPPKMRCVGQRDFDQYQHVLSGAAKALDLMLGTLVKMAGDETHVALVSDHGLLCGEARPRQGPPDFDDTSSWRRREGIVVLAGPETRRDEVIFGAHLLDIVPTLLTLLGIPLPQGLEGRLLGEAFETVRTPKYQDKEVKPSAPVESGPIPSDDPAFVRAAQILELERQGNRARSLIDGRRAAEALEVIERLYTARPENFEIIRARFECQLALRRIGEARDTLELLLDYLWETPQAALYQARLEYAAKRFPESLAFLEKIEQSDGKLFGLHLQLGLNLIKLGQCARAGEAFRRELEIRPESAESLAGLAYVHLDRGELDEAIEYALAAIGHNYNLSHAHFILGMAQARKGELDRALVAFRMVIALDPRFAPAHRCMEILYGKERGQGDLAQRHRELAEAGKNWDWGF